jgi:methylated-DNA-[protein]-cysteine S-methyltransferase
MTYWHEIDSPVGALMLVGTARALARIHFQAGPHPLRPGKGWQPSADAFAQVQAQLMEYFCGARAVGLANGANPLPIVVPCHRVIGADGTLTGFGGGLRIKRALLALEGAECAVDLFAAEEPVSAALERAARRGS